MISSLKITIHESVYMLFPFLDRMFNSHSSLYNTKICTFQKYLQINCPDKFLVAHIGDYDAFIVCLIHAEFGVILSYIRGRSMPFGWQAIRQLATPTKAHRLLLGS